MLCKNSFPFLQSKVTITHNLTGNNMENMLLANPNYFLLLQHGDTEGALRFFEKMKAENMQGIEEDAFCLILWLDDFFKWLIIYGLNYNSL